MAFQQDVPIKFFDPRKLRGRIKFEHVKLWRGDHSRCAPGHHTGECVAAQGWIVRGDDSKVVPNSAIRSIEDGAGALEQEMGRKGSFPQPSWIAKGWRQWDEATDRVKPTREVLAELLRRHIKGVEANMKHEKAPYTEIEKAKADARAKFEAANGLAEVPQRGKGAVDG